MKNNILILLIVLISLGALYFVFVYRPQQIRVECLKIASYEWKAESKLRTAEGKSYSEDVYNNCLQEAGIK